MRTWEKGISAQVSIYIYTIHINTIRIQNIAGHKFRLLYASCSFFFINNVFISCPARINNLYLYILDSLGVINSGLFCHVIADRARAEIASRFLLFYTRHKHIWRNERRAILFKNKYTPHRQDDA